MATCAQEREERLAAAQAAWEQELLRPMTGAAPMHNRGDGYHKTSTGADVFSMEEEVPVHLRLSVSVAVFGLFNFWSSILSFFVVEVWHQSVFLKFCFLYTVKDYFLFLVRLQELAIVSTCIGCL